jgi:RNA polymerase sigma-70 factor, ECF subfamily
LDKTVASEMVALLPRLRRFAYALTRSDDQADDLAQATLERAIRYVDKWQHGTRMDSWLFAIARNVNLNNLRAGRVRGEDHAPVDLDEHVAIDGEGAADARLTYVSVAAWPQGTTVSQDRVVMDAMRSGWSAKNVQALQALSRISSAVEDREFVAAQIFPDDFDWV